MYDEVFVPAVFAQWADPVLDAAGARVGDGVLDVGCGSGVLARAAARQGGVAFAAPALIAAATRQT